MVTHAIRLYPAGSTTGQNNSMEPVISEVYDEVVFNNVEEKFYERLVGGKGDSDTTKLQNELSEHWPTISDKADIGNIVRAQQFIDKEIAAVQDRILRSDCELSQVEQANSVAK